MNEILELTPSNEQSPAKNVEHRMIKLTPSSAKRNIPLLDRRLGEIQEEFFKDSWCYKSNNKFKFNLYSEIKKTSTHFQPTGNGRDEATEARLIDFNNEFGWSKIWDAQGNRRIIVDFHMRIDKEVPKGNKNPNISHFHITFEFQDGGRAHLHFDEKGHKHGPDWNTIPYEEHNRPILDVVHKIAEQFLDQVQVKENTLEKQKDYKKPKYEKVNYYEQPKYYDKYGKPKDHKDYKDHKANNGRKANKPKDKSYFFHPYPRPDEYRNTKNYKQETKKNYHFK